MLFMMLKMHYLMRVFLGMSKIVEFVNKVFLRCYQFLIFLFIWMTTQSVLVMITGTDLNSWDDSPYEYVGRAVSFFLMTYQNSIGNFYLPKYELWEKNYKDSITPPLGGEAEENKHSARFMICLCWFVWFSITVFNVIVLLNFLITIIS